MFVTAQIVSYNGEILTLRPDRPLDRELLQKSANMVELRVNDGRTLSPIQRRKIFALLSDISAWNGHEPEYMRGYFTWAVMLLLDCEYFSLSTRQPNCADMTTASAMIDYIVKFCVAHGVPTHDSLLDQCEDIYKYVYTCVEHRKCAICGSKADIHHTDRIGQGVDRRKTHHLGRRVLPLCRKHHSLLHSQSEKEFCEKWHLEPVKLDKFLIDKLKRLGIKK